MAAVERLSSGPPCEGWARSLRQETTLKDQYRRAIHHGDGTLENVGFDRWKAACCLQQQVDSTRGVEHTRRLSKSRAISARFTRRSVMMDLQGSELQTSLVKPIIRSNESSTRLHDEDANLTRDQALEKFGIDLSRVGAMTSARTAREGGDSNSARTGLGEGTPGTAGMVSTTGGIGREKGDNLVNRTGSGRGRAGNLTAEHGKGATGQGQKLVKEKLKVLDMLLSDESLCVVPAEAERKGKREEVRASSQPEESGPVSVTGENDANSLPEENLVDLSNGVGDIGCDLDALLLEKTPLSNAAVQKDVHVCEDPQLKSSTGALVPQPREVATVANVCASHEQQVGDEVEGAGMEASGDVLKDESTKKETIGEEPSYFNEKALPNHRPCWWWASLLPSMVDGIGISDTVFSAPTPVSTRTNWDTKFVAAATESSHYQHDHYRLLWAYSRPIITEGIDPVDDGNSNATSATKSRGGVLIEGDGDDGRDPAKLSLAVKSRRIDRRANSGKDCSPVRGQPSFQARLHSRIIDDKDELLCAARAICEYGKKAVVGANNGKGQVDGEGPKLKLPLAILKIWGRDSDEERRRNNHPSTRGQLEESCRGRRLRVVSLWTKTEVLEALRDMARGKWCRPKHASISAPLHNQARITPQQGSSSTSSTEGARTQPNTQPPDIPSGRSAASGRGGEQPAKEFGVISNDEGSCCVQAFTKCAKFAFLTTATSHPHTSPISAENRQASCPPQAVGSKSDSDSHVDAGDGVVVQGGDAKRGRSSLKAYGLCDGKRPGSGGDVVGNKDRRRVGGRNDVCIVNTRDVGGDQGWRGIVTAPAAKAHLAGPVFYRVAWRRTGGKVFVWKLTSRYSYLSNLSAHFCPLVRVGSTAPFTAAQAEEGAVTTATASMEILAKALRRGYDPTLQQLWADWAVNEDNGQWLLIEVHGVKTDADFRNAASLQAAPLAFANVVSKVRSCIKYVPPKQFCGDPDDLKARILSACPTQELPLAEVSKRVAEAAAKPRPSKPPTPSRVSETTKKAILALRKRVSEKELQGRKGSRSGDRQMRNQYWRCAGDFCEIRPGGQHQATTASKREGANKSSSSSSATKRCRMGDTGGGDCGRGERDEASGGDCEVEDIVGKMKHALAVEIPRTVLFRVVLNARATLLGWSPSASDFSQMEKPVQLCSACFMVCDALERDRIEATRRVMEAEDQAAREGKAKRNRRPPGWKSRLQHELEDSLGADRNMVFRLIDSFETATAAATTGTAGEMKKRRGPASGNAGLNNFLPPSRQKSSGARRGERVGLGVSWIEKYPSAEVRVEKEVGEDTGGSKIMSAVSNSVKCMQKGMKAFAAVYGGASGSSRTTGAARRSNTASLAPISSLKSSLPTAPTVRDKPARSTSLGYTDVKRKTEEELQRQREQRDRKKQQVRARRKAKERARRRLYRLTARDVRAEKNTKELSALNENNTEVGKQPEADSQKSGQAIECPTLLQPIAPITMLRGGVDQEGYDSAVSIEPSGMREDGNEDEDDLRVDKSVERSTGSSAGGALVGGTDTFGSHEERGDEQWHQALEPTAPEMNWDEEPGEADKGEGDDEEPRKRKQGELDGDDSRSRNYSDYREDAFEDDTAQQQLLQPMAPRENQAELEEEGLGQQRESEEITPAAVVKDNATSEYGDEDFEDDES